MPITEELNAACFIVRNSNGQQLAYVYFEDKPGRRSAAKLLSKDEARRIAANIAKLRSYCASRLTFWPKCWPRCGFTAILRCGCNHEEVSCEIRKVEPEVVSHQSTPRS